MTTSIPIHPDYLTAFMLHDGMINPANMSKNELKALAKLLGVPVSLARTQLEQRCVEKSKSHFKKVVIQFRQELEAVSTEEVKFSDEAIVKMMEDAVFLL